MLVLSCAALSVSSSRLPAVSTSVRLPAGSAGHLLLDRRTALRLPFAAAVSAAAALRPSPAAAIDLTLDVSGLRWADIRQGVGGVPRDGERVTVDYMMTRNIGVTPMAGGKIYSTKDSQQPFSWVLGDGSVIEGLDMAVLGRGGIPPMKPGGIRRVLIPQQLGYGVGRGVFQDNTAARVGVRSLLPVPPVGFEWRDKQGDVVNAYARFKDLYMNEMRLDEPGLLLDVILRPQDAAPEAAAESAVAMGGAAPPSSPNDQT
ncbi:hypothetical protein EMIHUDRAFT_443654 [Emiliania huxleyi CCMP1516]|uniref:peptidylprolyl isomerase n=2 Tax=Emiliania huxleyi TaxID=2903 RepID=A0A0D3JPI2_EMIH1|nr:hypothetical protein EMIHUDRAFT_443654 [Emiliania huxleyi CCMP1516]EOD25417.1 hypothetical protein EMIHUDRAFT_443654 [Emiliania huxleyi CCMP1516]|eukprot:XP_005777846.1 hypothetical protein EMIHUDRAFT_443654 [Emiliania huxleyi CCMP1516]